MRALRRNWPFAVVVVQLVLIAALSGYLGADLIFPETDAAHEQTGRSTGDDAG